MDKSPFVISRRLSAPRELVWRVWTDPNHLAQWWGPKGFTVDVAKLDLRPGGRFHYGMRAPSVTAAELTVEPVTSGAAPRT